MDLAGAVDTTVDRYRTEHGVPLLGVGVVRGDESHLVTYPPADGVEPALFEIGSITKTFTGLALAALVERGTVGLDDPVARHLPGGVGPAGASGAPVTLEHLATHTSGLPRLPANLEAVVIDEDNPYADYDERHLMAAVIDGELVAEPGTVAEYSNFGFGLLGFALARAAGTSFGDVVEREVCRPLGLADTYAAGVPAAHAHRRAPGHDQQGAPAKHWDNPTLAGAGCIDSTVTDMLSYVRANIAPPPVLATAIAATHQIRYAEPQSDDGVMIGNGLGWTTLRVPDGWRFIWHNGGTGGFGSFCAFDPTEGTGVVLLANKTHHPDLDRTGAALLRSITR